MTTGIQHECRECGEQFTIDIDDNEECPSCGSATIIQTEFPGAGFTPEVRGGKE